MEPFSITTGVLNISETGFTAIKTLRQTLNAIQHAPKDVREIRKTLEQTETSLNQLRTLEIGDRETSDACKAALEESGMVEAVNNCGKACETLNERLQQCTRHSTEDEMSKRDRLLFGFWNKDSIAGFKTNVETCQKVVSFAVSSTQLSLQAKFVRNSENGQTEILRRIQSLESELVKDRQLVLKQRQEPGQVLEGGSNRNTNSTQTLTDQGVINSRFELLDDAAVSLGKVASRLERERSQLTIGKVDGEGEAITAVGIPEGVAQGIDARIGDVKAGKKATAMVGVFPSGLDINSMFKRG